MVGCDDFRESSRQCIYTGMVTASEDVAITSGLLATDGRDRNHGTPLALHTCYKFPSVPLPFPPYLSPLFLLLIPS